jgi:hypothetical protein
LPWISTRPEARNDCAGEGQQELNRSTQVSGLHHVPAVYPQGKAPHHLLAPIEYEVGWVPTPIWSLWNIVSQSFFNYSKYQKMSNTIYFYCATHLFKQFNGNWLVWKELAIGGKLAVILMVATRGERGYKHFSCVHVSRCTPEGMQLVTLLWGVESSVALAGNRFPIPGSSATD